MYIMYITCFYAYEIFLINMEIYISTVWWRVNRYLSLTTEHVRSSSEFRNTPNFKFIWIRIRCSYAKHATIIIYDDNFNVQYMVPSFGSLKWELSSVALDWYLQSMSPIMVGLIYNMKVNLTLVVLKFAVYNEHMICIRYAAYLTQTISNDWSDDLHVNQDNDINRIDIEILCD